MSEAAPRKTLKQQAGEDQRRLMNQRRHDLTDRIRKKKRAQLIDSKRRYIQSSSRIFDASLCDAARSDSASVGVPTSSVTMKELAWALIRNKDVASLAALQAVLAKSDVDANDLFLSEIMTDDSPALLLANTLASFVIRASTTEEVFLLACRTLTNLAAAERRQTEEGYYGRRPEGWCDVLLRIRVVPVIINPIEQFASLPSPGSITSEQHLEIVQQCCWFVGNLAGDSQEARTELHIFGTLQPLVSCLQRALEWKLPMVAKNSAWALANLIRGDATAAASTFCSPLLLTPELLFHGLLAVEQHQQQQQSTQQQPAADLAAWWEVVEEIASIVAECTNRDDETVAFLSSSSNQLAEALARRLATSAQLFSESSMLSSSSSSQPDTLWRQIRITLSCLNAVGNMANSCSGMYVPELILAADQSLVVSVARLIDLGSGQQDIQAVACAAAWAAGVLLCDAGIQDHPSTTIAAPVLLPVLCKTLTAANFALQAEIVSALSNMLHDPPAANDEEMNHSHLRASVDHQAFMDMSALIARESETVVQIIQLLKRTDYSAALAAVQVLGTLLRLAPNFQTHFAEVRGVQSLEECCEQWSRETSYSRGAPSVADLAADLLDTFYSDDDTHVNDLDNDTPIRQPAVSAQGLFSFGEHPPSTVNNALASAAAPTDGGRGRGRGKPIPSWMQSSA